VLKSARDESKIYTRVRQLWGIGCRVQGCMCTICMYACVQYDVCILYCTEAAAANSLLREAYANARWANQLIFIMGDILLDHPTGNRITGASGFDTSACVWLGTHGCGGGEYIAYNIYVYRYTRHWNPIFFFILIIIIIYYYFLFYWFF